MSTASPLTVAEYFAGIGLVRLGLEQAGWTTLFANDFDCKKREMYCHHFGPAEEFLLGDIHALDPAKIPATTLATASFPCNDLSLAGRRAGLSGESSSAFWGFIHVLKGMEERRPPLVLLENVPGFLSSRGGADFYAALTALNQLGYSVDAFLIDAARFVPQSRRRLFVVAQRSKDRPQRRQKQDVSVSEHRPAPLAFFIERHPQIDWSVRVLPPLPKCDRQLASAIENIPLNSPLWWSTERRDFLLKQMSPRHRAQAEAMMQAPHTSYATVFRRVRAGRSMAELRTDGVAGCLRTPRGGSGRQILLAAGGGCSAVRLLTGRECARLMGADDYQLDVPLNQALFGFGDAVCVPVIRWIAETYLTPLAQALPASAVNV